MFEEAEKTGEEGGGAGAVREDDAGGVGVFLEEAVEV